MKTGNEEEKYGEKNKYCTARQEHHWSSMAGTTPVRELLRSVLTSPLHPTLRLPFGFPTLLQFTAKVH